MLRVDKESNGHYLNSRLPCTCLLDKVVNIVRNVLSYTIHIQTSSQYDERLCQTRDGSGHRPSSGI